MAINFELRTLIFIDSMQPQLSQFISKENQVYDPAEYDAALILEIAPAMEIHHLVDLALKQTRVRLGDIITERHFGSMLVHCPDQGEVIEAGKAILRSTNLNEQDRSKIELLTNKIIRGVEQDHAVLFTNTSKGNMVEAGESLLIMETAPAGYLTVACNEALKAARIKLIELKPYGATGRLVMSGPESEIDSAAEAAVGVLEKLNAWRSDRSTTQFG
jgi:ethanolamine utilization microcompartment shell protein EutS